MKPSCIKFFILLMLYACLICACAKGTVRGNKNDEDEDAGPDAAKKDDDGSGTDADADSDTDSDSDLDIDTDTDTDSDTDSDTDTDTDTDSDTDTDTDTDIDADADADACGLGGKPAKVFYSEKYVAGMYLTDVKHRILIRPNGGSDDPSTWDVLADNAAMRNALASADWIQGTVLNISSRSGQTVRLAFHSQSNDNEIWLLDEVCIGQSDDNNPPADPQCCKVYSSFESGTFPPSGWSLEGSSPHWYVLLGDGSDGSRCADADSLTDTLDTYLVTPEFTVP